MKKNRRQREKLKRIYSKPVKANVGYIKWNTKSKSNITALTRAENSIMYLKDGLKWRKACVKGILPIHHKSEFKAIFKYLAKHNENPYNFL